MKKWLATSIVAFTVVLCGCMAKVVVDKRPNTVLPIYSSENSSTNPVNYVVVDQGYEVRYFKFGFSTDIESMSAEICSNKTVSFQLGGLHSHSSTNGIAIRIEDLIKISNLFKKNGISSNDVVVLSGLNE